MEPGTVIVRPRTMQRHRDSSWVPHALLAVGLVLVSVGVSGCRDRSPRLPDGAVETCAVVPPNAPIAATVEQARAALDVALAERLAHYDINASGVGSCAGGYIGVADVLTGEVAHEDRVFSQDDVTIVLARGRTITLFEQ